MKWILPLLFLLTSTIAHANPSFTIGSNPYETVFAYPHDMLRWPNRAVFLLANPQTLPWQGDVTDIHNRPSASYTSNYQNVEFAPPSGYEGDPESVQSWMRVSSYAYKRGYTFGGLTTTKHGKFLVELNRSSTNMQLAAEGVARAYDSGGGDAYHLVPFKGKTEASKTDHALKVIYAHRLYEHPLGIKLRYTRKSSDKPGGYIRFTRDGTTYDVPHLTWGWATTGCNHIFGFSHINADAFFQNKYTVFKGRQFDLQLSTEHRGNYKTGIRYRTSTDDGDNYKWRYDDGSNFHGKYYIDEYWKDRQSQRLFRGYSKVRFWEVGNLDAGILFFLQRASQTNTEVNKLIESDPTSTESKKQLAVETNPFLNYEFKGGYLDCGVLLEISRTGLRNSSTRWNSVSKSDQEDVLWSTEPYTGWSSSWETFSTGKEWFFATGWEANASIGLYRRLAALLRLTTLRKYTWTEKLYGQTDILEGARSFSFHQTHRRNNFKNETWMTGSVGVSYGWGPVQTFLTLRLPMAYLIKQRTKLADNDGLLFEHAKRDMWQVQEPTTVRVMIVYALTGR